MAEQASGEAVAQAQDVTKTEPEAAKSGGDESAKSDDHSTNGVEPDSTAEEPPPADEEKTAPLETGKAPPEGEGEVEAERVTGEPEKAGEEGEVRAGEETSQVSPLEAKVIRQVEFYFGDRNLVRDKFLQQAMSSHDDGWVPISTLLTFKRLQALSSDQVYVITALRKATGNIVEVREDGEAVRRCPSNPVPGMPTADQRREIRDRSVYVKGFEESTKLDEIQEFFDQFGKTQFIVMRRSVPDRKFKGSVFVEFADKADAEKFVSLDSVKFKETELLKESKEAYFKRKGEERKQKKVEKKQDEMKTEEELRKKKEEEEELKKGESKVKTAGCILHFKGCGKDSSWEKLKEVFQEFATVAFIDFSRGDTEGYVRFTEENGAERALKGMTEGVEDGEGGGKMQLCGADTELRVLEGKEEEDYWQKMHETRQSKQARMSGRRGGRRGGWGHGGRGSGRKRKQQMSGGGEERPMTKQAKTSTET